MISKSYFLLLIYHLLFHLKVFSQDEVNSAAKKTSLGISISPDYSYRLHKQNSYFSDQEVAKIGFTTGLVLIHQLSKKIALETGLLYANKGYKTKELPIVNNIPDPPSPPDAGPVNTVHLNYTYHYLDVPLKLNYTLTGNAVKVYITAGFSANIYLGNTNKTYYSNSKESISSTSSYENEIFKAVNLSSLLGFGFVFEVSKKVALRIEPIYRQSLTSVSKQPYMQEFPFSLGMNTGILIKL